MKKSITHTWISRILFLLAIGFMYNSCVKNVTSKILVYENGFDQGQNYFQVYGPGGQVIIPKIENYNGSNVLGRFFNNYVFLQTDNLPKHTAISVEFDLYIHDKWEGNTASLVSNKPDLWVMAFDDAPVLITTFSNTNNAQSYPDFYLANGTSPSKANAVRTDLPGACALKGIAGGTSYYKIVKTVAHTASTFKIAFNDNLNVIGTPDTQICTKSWSIDNIRISTIKQQ
jgi:hypothetical protein